MLSKLSLKPGFSTQVLTLLNCSQRGLKNAPKFDKENDNKINKLQLAGYLDDLMKRRPQTAGGYISLPQENLKKMVAKAKTKEDLKVLIDAQANFIGHRNIVQNHIVDEMLLKALELKSPGTMLIIIEHHKELLYHPSPKVL